MYYSIAKLGINIDPFLIDKSWSKFIACDNSEVVQIKCIHGKEMYNINEYYIEKDLNRCYRYMNDMLLVNTNWTQASIFELKNRSSFSVFTNLVFYTHAVQRHMIQIHSSMIDYCGKGLLFLGPSGIGKTTMAELWNQYRSALIINGDMNFVQDNEDEFIGWGTPWHGSSPYCENTSVPVHALIILKQAPENYIRELSGF